MSAVNASVLLRRGAARIGAERIALLKSIGETGSISAAAKLAELSYKAAWDAVQALNNLFDGPLVVAQPGGARGGAAELTPRGRAVVAAFQKVEAELAAALGRIEAGLAVAPDVDRGTLLWSLGMKTSARNALRGVVTAVTDGAVNAEVTLKVAEGVEVVAIITRRSVAELGLKPGAAAIALIKSSFVTLAVGQGLRTSARNQLTGAVVSREDGAVNSEVSIALADGKTLTATITKESAEALALSPGDPVTALVKAQHVILAVE